MYNRRATIGRALEPAATDAELFEGGRPNVPKTLARVWRLLCGYHWQLVGSTVVILPGVAIGLIPPLLIRALISRLRLARLALWATQLWCGRAGPASAGRPVCGARRDRQSLWGLGRHIQAEAGCLTFRTASRCCTTCPSSPRWAS